MAAYDGFVFRPDGRLPEANGSCPVSPIVPALRVTSPASRALS
jgi:hypothetical protein